MSWSVWGSNSRPWRYQHHALPTELTDQLLLIDKIKVKLAFSSLQDRIFGATIYFGKEWGSGSSQNAYVFLSRHMRYPADTPKSSSSPSSAAGDKKWTTRTFVVVPVECRVNVMQWVCAGRLDILPAFYEQINGEKGTKKKKESAKRLLPLLQTSSVMLEN